MHHPDKFGAVNSSPDELLLMDAASLVIAVKSKNELATRQLLADYQLNRNDGYGKSLVIRTLGLLNSSDRDFLRGLY